jgi:protoporphyrinogen oxidase
LTPPSVGIIGAGPAGLTAAYLLARQGLRTEVWEADPHYVGGISRTVVHKGFRFDIGGHRFFSKSQAVEDFWTELLGDDLLTRDRLSRIYYRGKFYNYPLEAAEVIQNLGKRESLLSVASYLKAKLLPVGQPTNLEDWVSNKFGGRLYRAFFKSYTEKVWGIPCREIAADWAAQRIKGLSLTQAALAALFSGRPARSAENRSKVIKTLIHSFRYPRLGPGMMWDRTAERIRQHGGEVSLGVTVSQLSRDGDGWQVGLKHRDGAGERIETRTYDHVISSAPLGWLVQAIRPGLPRQTLEAAAALRYRDFLTVALILRPTRNFPDNWLYIHDPNLLVGRIQNFANWSPEMVPDPTLACYGLEYFCFAQDELWNLSDADLIALATRELEQLNLVQMGDVLDGAVVRQAKAYPVYDEVYKEQITRIRSSLQQHCPNLHVVGRNGMHKYNNQDHSMMTAMLTAQNILSGVALYDPWKVNQDAEYIEADEDPASEPRDR